MTKIHCTYCQYPSKTRMEQSGFFCSYGCLLASLLSGPKKMAFFIRMGIGIILTCVILGLAMNPQLVSSEITLHWILFFLASIVLVVLGYPLIHYTITSIFNKRWLESEVLTSVCILSAYGYAAALTLTGTSYLGPPGLIPFFLLGLFLIVVPVLTLVESICRQKSYENFVVINKLKPTTAHKHVKGQESDVSVASLKIGDIVAVYPGEIIPCDGEIVFGTTTIDESILAGEKAIFLKEKGDQVTGASVNRDSVIHVLIKSEIENHFVGHMIRVINQAVSVPPKLQTFLERQFPLVTLTVIGLAVGAYFFQTKFHFNTSFHPFLGSLAVLVVTRFYTMGATIPMILVRAIGKAAINGILIRSGNIFRLMSRMSAIFFDKTGTLTKGDFEFSKLFLEYGVNQGTCLSTLFSLEIKSTHPLSKGIDSHPWKHEIQVHDVKDFRSHAGLGICGEILERGKRPRFAAVGNQRFLKRFQMQVSRAMRQKMEELEALGETVILCGWDGQARGLVSFSDTLRSDVNDLLRQLGQLHVSASMITSDHDNIISYLTYAHGLENMYTRCLPDEKAKKIKNRQDKQNSIVGFVGKEIDSLEPFGQANVGFVVGVGTKVIEHPAQVHIFGNRLLSIPDLIGYSRKVARIIDFSTTLGFISNLGGLALTFTGLIHPVQALCAMTLSQLIIILLPLKLNKVTFGGVSHSEMTLTLKEKNQKSIAA